MSTLDTVEFWDGFHERENTEWYLPVDVVAREVLRVQDEFTAQSPSFAKKLGPEDGAGIGGGSLAYGGDRRGESRSSGFGCRSRPRILHPGCGSSTLGVVLQREYSCDVVNADFSEGVIESMSALYPDCEFVRSDARDASGFPKGSFDIAVDKGLFDSVTARSQGREEVAKKFLGEAARLLAVGGKYMLFSAFSNDGMGHKDMASMLSHQSFGDLQIRVLDTPPLEYPDQNSSYLYILTKVEDGAAGLVEDAATSQH